MVCDIYKSCNADANCMYLCWCLIGVVENNCCDCWLVLLEVVVVVVDWCC